MWPEAWTGLRWFLALTPAAIGLGALLAEHHPLAPWTPFRPTQSLAAAPVPSSVVPTVQLAPRAPSGLRPVSTERVVVTVTAAPSSPVLPEPPSTPPQGPPSTTPGLDPAEPPVELPTEPSGPPTWAPAPVLPDPSTAPTAPAG